VVVVSWLCSGSGVVVAAFSDVVVCGGGVMVAVFMLSVACSGGGVVAAG
jgi:hypothetical protein